MQLRWMVAALGPLALASCGGDDGDSTTSTTASGGSATTGGSGGLGGTAGGGTSSGGTGAAGAAGSDAGGAAGAGGLNGVGCLVEGVTYANGETVPDPFSCNTCACEQGVVGACTEIGCPEDCPDDTAPGSDCASCGPVDECLVVRTGCLPSCNTSEDCTGTSGFLCDEGVCRNLCG